MSKLILYYYEKNYACVIMCVCFALVSCSNEDEVVPVTETEDTKAINERDAVSIQSP